MRRVLKRRLKGLANRLVSDPDRRARLIRLLGLLPDSIAGPLRRRARALAPARSGAGLPDGAGRLLVPPGHLLAGSGPEGEDPPLAPVVVVLPQDGDAALTEQVVERLAQLQVATRAFAPLLVLSDLQLRAPRRFGYLVEVLPSRERAARLATDETWDELRRRRLATIVRHVAPARLVVLPEGADDGPGRQAALAVLDAGLAGIEPPPAQPMVG